MSDTNDFFLMNSESRELKMEVREDRASCYAKYPETGQRVPYRKDEATSGFLAQAILVRCSTSVFRMDACPGNLSQEV